MQRNLHILHVFSTFGAGGPQVRTAAIINRLGRDLRHTIVAMDRNFEAALRIAEGPRVDYWMPPPRKNSLSNVLALRRLVKSSGADLLITYNWGAIEAVASACFPHSPPAIHAEDGFGPDEASGLAFRRVLARRLLLNRIKTTVVPSRTLLRIAETRYCIAPHRLKFIPNGIDVERFCPGDNSELRRDLGIAPGEIVFGSIGHLRREKNLQLLLHAFAASSVSARLVLVGDGACREELQALANRLDIAHRVIFAGATNNAVAYLRAMDVFVMSSVTEQMPIALLEAMACAKPAIVTDVGDSRHLLGDSAAAVVVGSGDLEAYAASIRELASNASMRQALGTANRDRCVAEYSLDRMVTEYARLYWSTVDSAACA